LTTLRVAPVSAHPLQAPGVGLGKLVVPDGQLVLTGRERDCSASQVFVPLWPEGHAAERGIHWVSDSVEGAGQGLHAPDTLPVSRREPVSAQGE